MNICRKATCSDNKYLAGFINAKSLLWWRFLRRARQSTPTHLCNLQHQKEGPREERCYCNLWLIVREHFQGSPVRDWKAGRSEIFETGRGKCFLKSDYLDMIAKMEAHIKKYGNKCNRMQATSGNIARQSSEMYPWPWVKWQQEVFVTHTDADWLSWAKGSLLKDIPTLLLRENMGTRVGKLNLQKFIACATCWRWGIWDPFLVCFKLYW